MALWPLCKRRQVSFQTGSLVAPQYFKLFKTVGNPLGFPLWREVQSNLKSSNTDGSFTMVNSNSFLSPYETLPIAQENKYLGKFSYLIMKLYAVCSH